MNIHGQNIMLSGICFEITRVGAGRGYRVRGYHKVKIAKLGVASAWSYQVTLPPWLPADNLHNKKSFRKSKNAVTQGFREEHSTWIPNQTLQHSLRRGRPWVPAGWAGCPACPGNLRVKTKLLSGGKEFIWIILEEEKKKKPHFYLILERKHGRRDFLNEKEAKETKREWSNEK